MATKNSRWANGRRPRVMVVFGTRPEAIKMAPVIRQLKSHAGELDSYVVVTAQHRAMLDQVLDIFDVRPDADLDLMRPNQTLVDITVRSLVGLDEAMERLSPDMVLVQGDTTTALMGGMAAFYRQIPVGHIEAGLRTRDKYNPFPEEINRQFLDVLADLAFAPTSTSREALLAEGVPNERILVTGNTVIDALMATAAREHRFTSPELRKIPLSDGRRTVVVTSHRRENLGEPLRDICGAIRELLEARENLQVIFPVHLNPKVRETVWSILGEVDRAWLIDPLSYPDLVHLIKASDLVVTDSGGIQEEAPALGKPVLVIRSTTERPEGIEAGTARLVGVDREAIISSVALLLDNPREYDRMAHAINPYGDGRASERIVEAIRFHFGFKKEPPEPFEGLAEGQPLQLSARG